MKHPIRKPVPEWLRRIRHRAELVRAAEEFAAHIAAMRADVARMFSGEECAGRPAVLERPQVH